MPAQNIGKMIGFVSKTKRSGLDYDVLSAIAQQNIDAAAWLTEHSELLTLACERASAALAERFEEEVERACCMAPTSLTRPINCPAGTYVPYILELRDTVRRTELIDEKGKSSGYTKVRDAFFGGSNSQGRTFKIAEQSERLKTACDVARRYQSELDQHHLYDYDDMIGDFVDAGEHNDALRQVLQDTYTYIQVDEFQDTNGAQMRIIELLCDGVAEPNIMAVGDDDQAIMRFQGATIECANQFAAEFSPRSIVLKTNYRSTPAIVELGQAIAQQIEYRLDASSNKSIEAFKPQSDQVSFSENVYTGKAEEYAAVAASIKQRIEAGYLNDCEDPNEGIAVISAKHAALRSLIPFLVKENVPFSYRERQNLFASERMQTTLALLRCVTALARGQQELASSYLPQIVCAAELGGDHPSSVRLRSAPSASIAATGWPPCARAIAPTPKSCTTILCSGRQRPMPHLSEICSLRLPNVALAITGIAKIKIRWAPPNSMPASVPYSPLPRVKWATRAAWDARFACPILSTNSTPRKSLA